MCCSTRWCDPHLPRTASADPHLPRIGRTCLIWQVRALPMLKPWPRSLLPALYPLWPPLAELASANSSANSAVNSPASSEEIAGRALGLLAAAARQHPQDFSSQTIRGALPPLLAIIRAQSTPPPVSMLLRAGGANVQPRSRAQQLLLAAMKTLQALCGVRRILAPDAAEILAAAAPLLSTRQPTRVQEGALALCVAAAHLDADATWLLCAAASENSRPGRAESGLRAGASGGASSDSVWAGPFSGALVGARADYAANAAALLERVRAIDARRGARCLR